MDGYSLSHIFYKDVIVINKIKGAISFNLSLMAFLFSLGVQAYNFTADFNKGFYWNSLPVTMKPFASNNYDANNLNQFVALSVQAWESATGKNIWNIEPLEMSSQYTGNFIKWSENFGNETGYDPNTTLAITIRYNRGTFLERTVIILNGSIAYLRQNVGNALRTTILHEMGHTIGLDHSNVFGSVMYPTLSQSYQLANDDVEGMNALIDQTMRRQETGFISPFAASSNQEKVMACGTIVDISQSKPPSGGFGGSFLSGAMMMVLMYALARRKERLN